MKVTLKNGMVLEGTADQVTEAAKKLGEDVSSLYYKSSNGETYLISEMASPYLRNAILKQYRDWVNSLQGHKMSNSDFLRTIGEGPKNGEILSLMKELIKRK